jgi:hypothetical protein
VPWPSRYPGSKGKKCCKKQRNLEGAIQPTLNERNQRLIIWAQHLGHHHDRSQFNRVSFFNQRQETNPITLKKDWLWAKPRLFSRVPMRSVHLWIDFVCRPNPLHHNFLASHNSAPANCTA